MSIELTRNTDIIKYMGENKRKEQFICGFSMETNNVIENSRQKLEKKHIDMIVANSIKDAGAGFGVDTNIVTIITNDKTIRLDKMSKEEVSNNILNFIMDKIKICRKAE